MFASVGILYYYVEYVFNKKYPNYVGMLSNYIFYCTVKFNNSVPLYYA